MLVLQMWSLNTQKTVILKLAISSSCNTGAALLPPGPSSTPPPRPPLPPLHPPQAFIVCAPTVGGLEARA